MTKKQVFTFSGIAIIVLFLVSIINWINIQQNTIDNLETEITSLRNDLNNIINQKFESIKEQIIEELDKQNSNVFNAEYKTIGFNQENNTANVVVKFSLKEYTKGASIQLVYSENNETKSVPVTENDGIFEAELSLSFEDVTDEPVEYSISYIVGDNVIQNGHVINIQPSVALYDRFDFKGAEVSASSVSLAGTDITFYTNFQNRFNTDEKLKFTSCSLIVYYKEEIIDNVDLMNQLEVRDGYQSLSESGQVQKISIKNYDYESVDVEIKAVDGYGFEYILKE